ncbi:MAG: RNA polymerase sigma factor [Myxococcota bacterium]
MAEDDASRNAAEAALRHAYGRVLAVLAARSGDVAGAEDALSEAFVAALNTWPKHGVPVDPVAWLLTAARRRSIDQIRRRQVRARAEPDLVLAYQEQETMNGSFPDRRLELLFVCAHPAITPAARSPLMLQTVLGIDASRIASAFLVPPPAMSQRLVRAKRKIKEAGIRFRVPDAEEWPSRLDAVLEAVYAAYSSGWDALGFEERGLSAEALFLARMIVDILPNEAEAKGLLALLLFCESRRKTRRGPDGSYVPLSEQSVGFWDPSLISEAEGLLKAALEQKRVGRYQLEAAIQSAHTHRRLGRVDNWREVVALYDALLQLSPSVGAQVARAGALLEAEGAGAAWNALSDIGSDRVTTYQPYWAVRAQVLHALERPAESAQSLERAIGLTADPALRRYLIQALHGQQPND